MKKHITKMPSFLRFILRTIFILAYLAFGAWCFGALAYLPVESYTMRAFAAGLFAVFALGFLMFRPRKYFIPSGLLLMMLVAIGFSQIKPTMKLDWVQAHAILPRAEFGGEANGGKIKMSELRDFRYRTATDFDADRMSGEYTPDEVDSLDFIFVRAEGSERIIHSMLSFTFKDGRRIVFSLEPRRAKDDMRENILIPGIYKQYENIMLAGSERDLIEYQARTVRSDVFLYRSSLNHEQTQALFTELAGLMNTININSEFYNPFIYPHERSFMREIEKTFSVPLSIRLASLDGLSDAEAFKAGLLAKTDPGETFEELKMRSHINPKIEKLGDPNSFSAVIRMR